VTSSAAPVGVHGADEKALRFARPHRPSPGGFRGGRAWAPCRRPGAPCLSQASRRSYSASSCRAACRAVGDLHQRLAQNRLPLGASREIRRPPSMRVMLTKRARRVAAQAQLEAALALLRAVAGSLAAPSRASVGTTSETKDGRSGAPACRTATGTRACGRARGPHDALPVAARDGLAGGTGNRLIRGSEVAKVALRSRRGGCRRKTARHRSRCVPAVRRDDGGRHDLSRLVAAGEGAVSERRRDVASAPRAERQQQRQRASETRPRRKAS
jgi:hypothetical protein